MITVKRSCIFFWSCGLMYLLSSTVSFAQNMPAFSMQLTNGKVFTAKDLPAKRPVVIIYFSPDCEHCLSLMNALFLRIQDFKKAEIVMATFKPEEEVIEFEKNYNIAKYPNIKVGIEMPVFFFRKLYNLENTPFTALFDRSGKLVVSYKKDTPVDDLVKHLKAIQK
jgi:peroxiredoxin